MPYEIKERSLGSILDVSLRLIVKERIYHHLGLAVLVLYLGISAGYYYWEDSPPLFWAVFGFDLFIFTPVVIGLLTVVTAEFFLQKKPSLNDGWSQMLPVIGRLLVISAVYHMLLIVGIVLLLFPGLWLASRYMVTLETTVLERTGFRESFRRSSQLLQGSRKQAAAITLIWVLLTVIFNTGSHLLPYPLSSVCDALYETGFLIYLNVATTVLYLSCRCKKENLDLQLLANSVAEPAVADDAMNAMQLTPNEPAL